MNKEEESIVILIAISVIKAEVFQKIPPDTKRTALKITQMAAIINIIITEEKALLSIVPALVEMLNHIIS